MPAKFFDPDRRPRTHRNIGIGMSDANDKMPGVSDPRPPASESAIERTALRQQEPDRSAPKRSRSK